MPIAVHSRHSSLGGNCSRAKVSTCALGACGPGADLFGTEQAFGLDNVRSRIFGIAHIPVQESALCYSGPRPRRVALRFLTLKVFNFRLYRQVRREIRSSFGRPSPAESPDTQGLTLSGYPTWPHPNH